MQFFFYGTLIDPDIRRLVLAGRTLAVEPASLAGWRCVALPGVSYPTIVADPDSCVTGALARGVDAEACRRLTRYEGRQYRQMTATVTDAQGSAITARVFKAPGNSCAPTWEFEPWLRRHKDRAVTILRRGVRPAAAAGL